MEETQGVCGYNFNEKGIPNHFTLAETLGTVGGDLYVDKEFVRPTTTKGYISETELHRGFEEAERFFSQNPTANEHVYDSLKFHTYDHSPYLIYCLPVGVVYYKELDHE